LMTKAGQAKMAKQGAKRTTGSKPALRRKNEK